MPEVGELLVAKYRVLALLGAGGMGSVYRAENVLTGKHVALKWMHPQYATSPDAAERLIREARAASRLSHPNVVDVYDVIRDDQTLFLVMELLQGESLRDFLRSRGRPRELPMHELIAILLGAMSGVAAAHAQGVIHRDLKPDNIFLERIPGVPQPIAKVLDFGIAKLAESGDVRGATLTQTGTAIGTPVYMSFEQLRGDKNIDFRTDVYAFGVMLYEALVGHAPFTAATLSELAIKVATTEAVPLKNLRPDVPTGLCAIIERAIRRNREERWPDVPSLMAALAPFAQLGTFRENMSFQDMTAPRAAAPQRRAQRASPLEPDWAGTAAFPHTQAASVPVATPRATHVPSDSLVARELDDTDSPKSHTLPVWVAAAALLAVTVIAAVLLLGSPGETKPNSVARPLETTTSTVMDPPPLAPPTATPPPGLQIEAAPQEPTAVPGVEPVPPVVTQPELPTTDNNSDEPSVTRRRRSTRAARELPRAEREPQHELRGVRAARPEPEREPIREREPAREPARPKNATDLLGF